ncbi:helix-turn-helix transcriptional regulator [Mycobacteroides abscessus]|uniref:helix-turn-helix transcriptional regulator n=1 Tax=Mycobacteroides abscessus TaxID=36809 RepID=UPI003076E5D4
MSTDYYARLEGARGPQPSEQMIAAIAQGLHLSREERDHLFRLAGHQPPVSGGESEYISPGLMRIFDRLTPDTAAEIVTELGETLRQTPLGIALAGDLTRYAGPARSIGYRWFTDPATRSIHPVEDHQFYSRMYASGLRRVLAARGPGSKAARFAELLNAESEQFRALWKEHEVGVMPKEMKRFRHPEVGLLELNCQILLDPVESTSLLVYTAVPGSESYEKLQLLAIIGASSPPGR